MDGSGSNDYACRVCMLYRWIMDEWEIKATRLKAVHLASCIHHSQHISKRSDLVDIILVGLSPHRALNPEFTYKQPPGFKPGVEQIFFLIFSVSLCR